ncbi:MAG: polysaccharide biosynthesis tyrosine autokinase [Muribaculaceae bacterium]|nr:polysaccharide biosynthesis tyrosine autokinase [Muribaculaceae bacterium]
MAAVSNDNTVAERQDPLGENIFDIKAFLKACGRKWQWFAWSLFIFLFIAAAWTFTRIPQYERQMAILVKDQGAGGSISDVAGAFSMLGLGGGNSNVNNELYALTSPAVMQEVVKDLQLQMNYLKKDFPHGETLYGDNLPWLVTMPGFSDSDGARFTYEVNPDGSGKLYKFRKTSLGKKYDYSEEVKVPAGGGLVKTPIGQVQIMANPRFSDEKWDETEKIVVGRMGFLQAVEFYSGKLKGELASKEADVIELSIEDSSKQRGDEILDKVLQVYTQRWINDKNVLAQATSDFINDRLTVIEKELSGVDNDIMRFQSEHAMVDMVEQAKLSMASGAQYKSEAMEVATQLEMARYVNDYVKKPANKNSVIPVNTGSLNSQLEAQIVQYNQMLLTRNNLEAASSAANPLVKDYDNQLVGMREAISRSLENQTHNLANSLAKLEREQGSVRKELAEVPKLSTQLLSDQRQQAVKQELYLYLLQKREENELSQTFSADNLRIITPPSGPLGKTSPKTGLILGVAFVLGLLLPGCSVYALEAANDKVRSRKDLDRMSAPFVGEIPQVGRSATSSVVKKLLKKRSKKGANSLEKLAFRVQPGKRDATNEAFRILRGNIDFMMRNAMGQVVQITSFNPGSGKSFVAYNLAESFAIKGKRVLLIDCDLRHGSISQYVKMPSKGLSAYLTGNVADWHKVLVKSPESNLEVMPIGHRPPNPAELLDTSRMNELIEEAKQEFDIVLLDCPPIDVVVDTQVLAPLADRTLVVVRAGLFAKSNVATLDELYNSYRFKNISVILNGTDSYNSRYGSDSGGYYGSEYAVEE